LNTKLVSVTLLIIFVVYWFILSSVYFGFPPNFPTNYPNYYLFWFAIGLIAFQWSIYFLTIIEAKSKILPLIKLGVTWIVSTTVAFASLSVVWFSYLVTKDFAVGLYFFIPLLAGSIASYILGKAIFKEPKKGNGST